MTSEGIKMTLPDERTRAIQNARIFLQNLLDPKKTPKVPRNVRLQARSVLKHFPTNLDLQQAAKDFGKVFEKPDDL